jgi:RNase P/RNase MRP subunit p29
MTTTTTTLISTSVPSNGTEVPKYLIPLLISQKFVYDSYEKLFGDGFYVEPVEDWSMDKDRVTIRFQKINKYWVQSSHDSISGLDGDCVIRTLNALNKKCNTDDLQITTKMCVTRMKQQGITKRVLKTPLNKLSKSEFVFRVLDEMVNCKWKAQAEYIISLIGPYEKSDCIGVKNSWGKVLYERKKNN